MGNALDAVAIPANTGGMMDIYDLAKHLPDCVHWGDEITPMILDEIVTPLLESARRADKRAREECADICKKISEIELSADCESNADIAVHCERSIRATIPEDRP